MTLNHLAFNIPPLCGSKSESSYGNVRDRYPIDVAVRSACDSLCLATGKFLESDCYERANAPLHRKQVPFYRYRQPS